MKRAQSKSPWTERSLNSQVLLFSLSMEASLNASSIGRMTRQSTPKQKGDAGQLTEGVAEEFLKGVVAATGLAMPADLEKAIWKAAYAVASRMASLAISDRNGIWAFILRNAYRPGLLTGQFNGLVSNPPWLAMSRLADNPYRSMLRERARMYGIQPEGQSFLHLELGTTHLLHAVDRYLGPHASIACLVPGTRVQWSPP